MEVPTSAPVIYNVVGTELIWKLSVSFKTGVKLPYCKLLTVNSVYPTLFMLLANVPCLHQQYINSTYFPIMPMLEMVLLGRGKWRSTSSWQQLCIHLNTLGQDFCLPSVVAKWTHKCLVGNIKVLQYFVDSGHIALRWSWQSIIELIRTITTLVWQANEGVHS